MLRLAGEASVGSAGSGPDGSEGRLDSVASTGNAVENEALPRPIASVLAGMVA